MLMEHKFGCGTSLINARTLRFKYQPVTARESHLSNLAQSYASCLEPVVSESTAFKRHSDSPSHLPAEPCR